MEFNKDERLVAGDAEGLKAKEHEANGYQRGYSDASAHFTKIINKLTQRVIQKYHEGFNNGYADGYDVAKGGRNPRQLNPPTEESILQALIDEGKRTGQKQIGGGENHEEVRDTEKDDVLEL